MAQALDTLVEFISVTRLEDLPAPVIAQAKIVLMDTIAAILAGSKEAEVKNLARLASQSTTTRNSTMFGHPRGADPGWASLVNATAGTSTELDEGNAYAKGHPAIHVLPAALALGEELNASGAATLLSMVLGYEMAARVAQATSLRSGTHPHGTWGALGASAAAAKLMGMDAAGIRETIDIASSLTLATSFRTATDGALVRNIYAGMSNRNGLFAAQLYQCGFTGEREGVANVFGKIMSDTFDENALTDELGTRFEIMRGYFKKHSCCRYNHAALDALELIRASDPIDPAQVKQVRVESYRQAALLNETHPTTTLAARFSVPYAVAISLVRRSTAPAAFDATALEDGQIRSLAERVAVVENADFTAMTPSRRPARVTVEMTDGRVLTGQVYHSKGDPEIPFSKQELVDKYMELASPVIGSEHARQVLGRVGEWPALPNIRMLTELLSIHN